MKTITDCPPEERAATLEKMKHAKNVFYGLAVVAGHHQFLEFAGLMHEYIVLCEKAPEAGKDFSSLPMEEHHAKYLAEKLECIYGPTLKRSHELAKAFLVALFGTPDPVGAGEHEHGIVLSYLRLLRAANAIGQQEAEAEGNRVGLERAKHRVELLDELIRKITGGLHGGRASGDASDALPI
jgi:hypothetical protein